MPTSDNGPPPISPVQAGVARSHLLAENGIEDTRHSDVALADGLDRRKVSSLEVQAIRDHELDLILGRSLHHRFTFLLCDSHGFFAKHVDARWRCAFRIGAMHGVWQRNIDRVDTLREAVCELFVAVGLWGPCTFYAALSVFLDRRRPTPPIPNCPWRARTLEESPPGRYIRDLRQRTESSCDWRTRKSYCRSRSYSSFRDCDPFLPSRNKLPTQDSRQGFRKTIEVIRYLLRIAGELSATDCVYCGRAGRDFRYAMMAFASAGVIW